MTYWITPYLDIKNQLITDLEALTDEYDDLVFDHVYFGRKASPEQFPCAIIWPMTLRTDPTTLRTSYYPMPFRIIVVSQEEAHIEEGFDDVIGRLGLVEKMLVDDRQFHGLTDNLEVDVVEPDVYRPRVRTRHEAALTVRFIRFYLPTC